jgi:hypothetical protein
MCLCVALCRSYSRPRFSSPVWRKGTCSDQSDLVVVKGYTASAYWFSNLEWSQLEPVRRDKKSRNLAATPRVIRPRRPSAATLSIAIRCVWLERKGDWLLFRLLHRFFFKKKSVFTRIKCAYPFTLGNISGANQSLRVNYKNSNLNHWINI